VISYLTYIFHCLNISSMFVRGLPFLSVMLHLLLFFAILHLLQILPRFKESLTSLISETVVHNPQFISLYMHTHVLEGDLQGT